MVDMLTYQKERVRVMKAVLDLIPARAEGRRVIENLHSAEVALLQLMEKSNG